MPPLASPRAVAGFPDPATRADRQVSIPHPPDGLGRRRLVALDLVNVSWHRYDLGWNVLGDYAAGGGAWGVGARVNSYHWHGMTPLAETPGANPGTGATRHHLHDHLGSTRALFDGGKARLARLDYEPHGQPTRALGTAANRSFTGKQYDASIGMYHFPYRHYSPSHARWMTRDPLGMVDGPNVYAYVRGAAHDSFDPLGLVKCDCDDEREEMDDVCTIATLALATCALLSLECGLCLLPCLLLPWPASAACAIKCAPKCARAGIACATAAAAARACSRATKRYNDCLARVSAEPCCNKT